MGIPHFDHPVISTVATCTIDADPSGIATWQIDGIYWSYGTTPTAGEGSIKVESPSGTPIFEQDIVAAGPGCALFPNGLNGAVGQAIIVTLEDAGAAVQGILTVLQH